MTWKNKDFSFQDKGGCFHWGGHFHPEICTLLSCLNDWSFLPRFWKLSTEMELKALFCSTFSLIFLFVSVCAIPQRSDMISTFSWSKPTFPVGLLREITGLLGHIWLLTDSYIDFGPILKAPWNPEVAWGVSKVMNVSDISLPNKGWFQNQQIPTTSQEMDQDFPRFTKAECTAFPRPTKAEEREIHLIFSFYRQLDSAVSICLG